jgi:hypothetical protein
MVSNNRLNPYPAVLPWKWTTHKGHLLTQIRLFANHSDLYNAIDSTPLGEVPWQGFSLKFNSELSDGGSDPPWMTAAYDVWFRDPHVVVKNMIGNPDYKRQFDTAPVRHFSNTGRRKYQNFMSGDWAWTEAVCPSLILFYCANCFTRTSC